MATATTGEEYKLLHSTPKLVKMAKLFSLIWILAVTAPALYFVSQHAESLKEYAVVRAVGEANGVLSDQYDAFSAKVLKNVDIDKYTATIKTDGASRKNNQKNKGYRVKTGETGRQRSRQDRKFDRHAAKTG